jgi:predicted nucleotidyltransferase
MDTEKMLAFLRKGGMVIPDAFVTGSRAFGWHTPESDFDICVHQGDMEKATAILASICEEVESSGYNSGKKGKAFGFEVNLIPLHPLDMVCWWLATQEIARLAKIPGVRERLGAKETKHGYFEMLRGFYKASIPYHGAPDTIDLLRRLMQPPAGSP